MDASRRVRRGGGAVGRHHGRVTATLPARADAPDAPGGPDAPDGSLGIRPLLRVARAGCGAGAWSAVMGLGVVAAPVLLAWLAAGAQAPAPDALSVAVSAWLLAAGATLSVGGVSWSLAPLGLTLVLAGLSARGASWAADVSAARGRRAAAVLVTALAATVAGLAAAAAAGSALPVRAEPVEAAVHAAALAVVGACVGVLREHRRRDGAAPLSVSADWPSRVAAACVGAVALLVAGAAGMATVAVAASGGQISSLVAQLDPGVVGGLALLATCVAYLPTLMVWVLAVLVGPGVAVGSQVVVSSTAVEGGPLPGFPLLGAVPGAVPGWLVAAGPVLLLAAGLVAGLLLARRRRPDDSWLRVAAAGAVTTVVVGGTVGLACAAASGAMGPGDWAWVGPAPVPVGTTAGLAVGVVATAVLVLSMLRDRRRSVGQQPD